MNVPLVCDKKSATSVNKLYPENTVCAVSKETTPPPHLNFTLNISK